MDFEWRRVSLGFLKLMFLVTGSILLLGMGYNIIIFQQKRIYPPKKVVKDRAVFLGKAGALFLVVGLFLALLLQ